MISYEPSLDPVMLRRIFLMATRELFSTDQNYGDLQDELGKWKWSEDEKIATLRVDLDHNFNAEGLKEYPVPTVWVGVDDFDFSKISVDNVSDLSADGSRTTYTSSCTTSVRISCVSKRGDEALAIATAAAFYFAGMRPMMMNRLGFSAMEVRKVSSPKKVKDAPDRYVSSDCIIALSFNFALITNVEGHRLKTFQVRSVPLTR